MMKKMKPVLSRTMETTKNLSIICTYLNLVKKSYEDNFTSC